MVDFKKLRNEVIVKTVLVVLIIIAGIALAVFGNFMAAPAAQAGAEAGLSVMSGDSSTVSGMAVQNAAGSALTVGRIIAGAVLFILGLLLVFNIHASVYKYWKDKYKEEEKQ